MNKLQSIIETPLAATFGQTLLHSIWQGVFIVALYLLVSRLFKKAHQRVWLGLSAFGLQFLASLVTFLSLLPRAVESPAVTASKTTLTLIFGSFMEKETSQSLLESIQANVHWLFAGWLIGFIFLALRQLGGMAYVHYLKQTGIVELNAKARHALNEVINKLDSAIPDFRAYGSVKVQTAMVLGYMKPVLLLPMSLISGLNSQQLELIIAHEIAHIKRNDFVINLIQTLVENLFFYHPAYWLVSYQIRENREHACDDFAAELTGNGVLLAKTLAQIQLTYHNPSLAMAFGKKKMPMLGRIQRLLGVAPRQQKIKLTALLLMIAAVSTLSFTQKQQQKEQIATQKMAEKIWLPGFEETFTPVHIARPDSGITGEKIYLGFGDDDIHMTNKTYDVKINPDGITINGEAKPLTPAQKEDLRKHFAAIKEASKELETRTKGIHIESEKIHQIQMDIQAKFPGNPSDDPEFQKTLAAIEASSKEIQKYSTEYQKKVQSLNLKDAGYEQKMENLSKDFEAKMKDFEVNMKTLEINMEGFEDKMKKYEVVIQQELEIPVSKLQAIIEEQEVYLEESAGKIGENHEAIMQMLPEEVRGSFGDFPVHSRPPKPVKPVKPVKQVKPVAPAITPAPPLPPKTDR